MNSWTFLCRQICHLFYRKVTNFCLEAAQKGCHSIHRYGYVFAKEIVPYQELNRWRKMRCTAESLDELKGDLKVNGLQSPVTLAIDPVSYRCNLHDDNHAMTYATELNLMWIRVRVLRLSLRLANSYLKAPKAAETFPNLPCPYKFGFTIFR